MGYVSSLPGAEIGDNQYHQIKHGILCELLDPLPGGKVPKAGGDPNWFGHNMKLIWLSDVRFLLQASRLQSSIVYPFLWPGGRAHREICITFDWHRSAAIVALNFPTTFL